MHVRELSVRLTHLKKMKHGDMPFEFNRERRVELPTLVGNDAARLFDRFRGWLFAFWFALELCIPLGIVAAVLGGIAGLCLWGATSVSAVGAIAFLMRSLRAEHAATESALTYLTETYGAEFRWPKGAGALRMRQWRGYLRREFTRLGIPEESWPASVTAD